MAIEIHLQPAQGELLDLIEHSPAVFIGVGGGRGCGKSAMADRIALVLMMDQPGMVCCLVMRNFDQVRKYHVDPLLRDFPVLDSYYRRSDHKLRIPASGNRFSDMDISYAENLEEVKRRIRSGNYRYIFIDQAEQFTWDEIVEMSIANRSIGAFSPKIILFFNMGGIGIQDLARRFGPQKRFGDNERAEDYVFLHVFPQDNFEWSRSECEKDGITEEEYYSWTDAQRFEFFTQRTPYGRKLNALDDATRNRDLLGSWESLEGAFFARVYDYKATLKSAEVAEAVLRDWDVRWMSTDWGKTHYCSTHWHGKCKLSPREVKDFLGWDVPEPLTVISTYRRLIVNEMTSTQVGKLIVEKTPKNERERLKSYFFSPEQFGDRDSEHTTADLVGMELRPFGMPYPERADNARKVGWGLMAALLNNTRIWATPPADRTPDMIREAGDTVWIISSECPELLDAIPMAMRNPKDLDDVVKGDLSRTDMNTDVLDDNRYGLLSMLGAVEKPARVEHAERQRERWEERRDGNQVLMAEIAFRAEEKRMEQFSISARSLYSPAFTKLAIPALSGGLLQATRNNQK